VGLPIPDEALGSLGVSGIQEVLGIFPTVLTENLVIDRVGIGESKAELEQPIQRDYLA
jgi:hypothetical protein